MAHALHLLSNPYTHDARVRNETRALARGGHDVTVIGWDRAGIGPVEHTEDGVRVVRVANTPAMERRRLDILRLKGWWRLAEETALAQHKDRPVDIIHAHDLDTLPAAVRLKRTLGVPVVFDAHEIWGHMIARDLPPPVPQYFHHLERRLLPHIDALVTVNEPLASFYHELGVSDVTLVMNAKPIHTKRYKAPPKGPFTVLYIGTLNEARFLMGTLDALDGLHDVQVIIGGLGKSGYVQRLQARIGHASNATFLGPVPADEVLPRTIDAHVVLCMTDPGDRNNRIATANKQFEAMSCGRPILTSQGTYPGTFTEQHQVGLAVAHTTDGVHDGVAALRDDPELAEKLGRQALATARSGYDWSAQEERLLALYARLAGGNR